MIKEIDDIEYSRIQFVKEMPSIVSDSAMVCSIRNEVFYVISRREDGRADVVVKDFKMDCSRGENTRARGVRGKFSSALCDDWDGRWASECPLMQEYLGRVLEKQEAYCEWKSKILAVGTDSITDSLFGGATIRTYLKATKIATDTTGKKLRIMTPAEADNVKRLELKLSTTMGVNLDGVGGELFRNLQDQMTSFYRIPRRGEHVELSSHGTCVINDFDFSNPDEIMAIAITTGPRERVEISIPIGLLTWSRLGYWMKEHSGFVETIGGALLWLKFPLELAIYYSVYGLYSLPVKAFNFMFSNSMIDYTQQSEKYIHRMMGGKMQYFYTLPGGTEIPVPPGGLSRFAIRASGARLGLNFFFRKTINNIISKYDQVILSIFDGSVCVMPENTEKPLGMRHYVNADGSFRDITLDSSMLALGTEKVSNILKHTGEVIVGGVKKGYSWLSDKTGGIISAGKGVVEKIFYGALAIGGVVILVNLTN